MLSYASTMPYPQPFPGVSFWSNGGRNQQSVQMPDQRSLISLTTLSTSLRPAGSGVAVYLPDIRSLFFQLISSFLKRLHNGITASAASTVYTAATAVS